VIDRLRTAARDDENGFTLIELLVVMIIIGILASIAIPVFLSQRQKGYDASVKSDLRGIANELESYNTDYQSYPPVSGFASGTNTTTISTGDSVRSSAGNSFKYFLNTGATAYCLVGVNAKGTRPWEYISSQGGLQPNSAFSSGSSLSGITACSVASF
jgi:type IV pilus assembly protein PilA